MHLQPLMSQMASTAADAPGTQNFVTRAHSSHVSSEPLGGARTTKKAASLTQATVSTPWERSVSFAGHKVLSFPLWGIELGSPSSEFRVLSAGHGFPLCALPPGAVSPLWGTWSLLQGTKSPSLGTSPPQSTRFLPPTLGLTSLLLGTGPFCRTQSSQPSLCQAHGPFCRAQGPHPQTQLQSDTGCLLSGRSLPFAGHRFSL